MSLIKNLKDDPKNQISVIEILEMIIPDKKSKYVDLLLRLMKTTPQLDEAKSEAIAEISRDFPFMDKSELSKYSPIQVLVIRTFMTEFFDKDLKEFVEFCELNELGYVEKNDLSTYKSIKDIREEKAAADLKKMSKVLENETKRVYEDDEWLIIRPLSFNSSKKYGANTKWCTTMLDNQSYFTKYAGEGVLIYTINKKSGYKVASYRSLSSDEFSFWDEKDNKIDIFNAPIPNNILMTIREESKNEKAVCNLKLPK